MPIENWLELPKQNEQHAQEGDPITLSNLCAPLKDLATYYAHLAKGNTKDPTHLTEQLAIIRARKQNAEQLNELLSP